MPQIMIKQIINIGICHIYSNRSHTPNSSHPRIEAAPRMKYNVVAALEQQPHACANSIEQVWSQLQMERTCLSYRDKTMVEETLDLYYCNVGASLTILSQFLNLCKPVFCATVFVDYTIKYWSEINKNHPQIRATLDCTQVKMKLIVAAACIFEIIMVLFNRIWYSQFYKKH